MNVLCLSSWKTVVGGIFNIWKESNDVRVWKRGISQSSQRFLRNLIESSHVSFLNIFYFCPHINSQNCLLLLFYWLKILNSYRSMSKLFVQGDAKVRWGPGGVRLPPHRARRARHHRQPPPHRGHQLQTLLQKVTALIEWWKMTFHKMWH